MKSIDNIKDLSRIDLEKLAQAIEADASQALPDLRTALAEAKAGQFASVHTPAAMEARKRGRPVGSVKADAKVSTTIRFDRDVLASLKATGAGWQTRVNDLLRAEMEAGCFLLQKP